MFNVVDSVDQKTGYIFKLSTIRRVVLKISDELNPFKSKSIFFKSNIPRYDIYLSENDLNYLDDASEISLTEGYGHYRPEFAQKKRDVTYSYNNGKAEKAKISLHGREFMHYFWLKKSFRLKFPSDNYLNNTKRFNFIIPHDRSYTAPFISNEIVEDLGFHKFNQHLGQVYWNGIFQGVYFVEEKLDKNYFEKNNESNIMIVKLDLEKMISSYVDLNFKNNNQDIGGLGYNNYFEDTDMFSREINHQYEKLNYDFDLNLVNVDKTGAFLAWATLLGKNHDIIPSNLRTVYSLTDGKFYFVPRIETNINPLILEDGSFESNLFTSNKVLINALMDDEIRSVRNNYLKQLVKNKKYYLNEYKIIIDKYLPLFKADHSNVDGGRMVEKNILDSYKTLESNLDLIEKYLSYSYFLTNVTENYDELNIVVFPNSAANLIVNNFDLNLNENYTGYIDVEIKNKDQVSLEKIYMNGNTLDLSEQLSKLKLFLDFDSDLKLIPNIFDINLRFNSNIELINITTNVTNSFTDKELLENKKYILYKKNRKDNQNLIYKTPNEFIASNKNLNLEYDNDYFVLKTGEYIIQNDLIFPKNMPIKIEEGVNLKIADNKSILFYSSVIMDGSESKKIVIEPLNSKFSVVGIIGSKNEIDVEINYLDFSGGNEDFINGLYLSGGLSVYHANNISIKNSIIHKNNADDGLNIKYGDVILDSVTLSNNFADQVDLDFVNAVITNSNFTDSGLDDNGDGIDFSGSLIILKNNKFSGFLDKGVSVGENSKVIAYNNYYYKNGIGMAVKDSSQVFCANSTYIDNNIAVSLYQKKQIFNGGIFYDSNNIYQNFDQLFMKDKKSKIVNCIKNIEYNNIILNNLNYFFEGVSNGC